MTDKLKQYIDEHRDQFDTELPDGYLFKRIQQELPGKAKAAATPLPWKIKHLVAAAAVLLCIVIAAFYFIPKQQKEAPVAANETPAVNNDNPVINEPVYAKQISQFREVIVMQQEELKKLENEYPQLYHQFVSDINELDSSYQSLKTKLSANPNREMLLEAMIQNLQLQSELLNRQLVIIKEIKQKNKSNEKNTI
jgi:uncharacterized membrane protein YdfJ with MMPL/SSD domain